MQKNNYILDVSPTPNANSYKWIINYNFAPDDMYEYSCESDTKGSNLATGLWKLNSNKSRISRIFFHDNMIVLHKTVDIEWSQEFLDEISSAIEDHIGLCCSFDNVSVTLSESEQMIVEVINDYIQPAVSSHGGLIKFHKFDQGVVYLSLHGACNGCQSSSDTLYNFVENILKFYIPSVLQVSVIN